MPAVIEVPRGFTPLFRDHYKHLPTGLVVSRNGEEEGREWYFVNVTEPGFRAAYLAEKKQQVNLIRDFEVYWKLFALPKKKNYVVVTDPDVREVLSKRVVICSGCSKFSASSAAGPTFKDHYKANPSCLAYKYDQYECSGGWLDPTGNRRRVFVVTETKGQILDGNDADQDVQEVSKEVPEGAVVISLSDDEGDGDMSPPTGIQPEDENNDAITFKSAPQDNETSPSDGDSEATLVETNKNKTQSNSQSLSPVVIAEEIDKRLTNGSQGEPFKETQPQSNMGSDTVVPETNNNQVTTPREAPSEDENALTPGPDQLNKASEPESPQINREPSATAMIENEALIDLIAASSISQGHSSDVSPDGSIAGSIDGEGDSPINESAFFDPVRDLSQTYVVEQMSRGSQVNLNSQTIDPALLISDRMTLPQPEGVMATEALADENADDEQDSGISEKSEDDSIELLSIETISPHKSGVRTRSASQYVLWTKSEKKQLAKPATKARGSTKPKTKKAPKVRKSRKLRMGKRTPFPRTGVDKKLEKAPSYVAQSTPDKGTASSKRITRSESQTSSPTRQKRSSTASPTTKVTSTTGASILPQSPSKKKAPARGKRLKEESLVQPKKNRRAKKSSNDDVCVVPLPPNHTDANFDVETWKAMATSFDVFRMGIINKVNNELLDSIDQYPRVVKSYENYFKNLNANVNVLPYVLLDCLTDDLWNADDEIRDNFRFTLNAGDTPSIFVYSENTDYSFPVTTGLKNIGGENGWSFSFKIDMSDRLATSEEFCHSYNINVDNLDYDGICEMLMLQRVVIYTVIHRLVREMDVLETSSLCEFVSQAFEKVRSGEVATRMVNETLYSHIARWKE